MATKVIRIKETVTTPDDVTTYACTNYWYKSGEDINTYVIYPGETAEVDESTLADHVASGLVEEVVA